MKYYLYSNEDIVIGINGLNQEFSTGKTLLIPNNTVVTFYPLKKELLPFTLICSTNKLNQNKNIKTTSYKDFIIIEPVFSKIYSPDILLGKNFKSLTACLIGKPYCYLIQENLKNYKFECKEHIKNFEIYEQNNTIILQADYYDNDYIVAFHKNEKIFYEFIGKVVIENQLITVIKDKETFSRHGEILKFEITTNKIKLLSQESIYLNGAPANHAPFLNHIAFFEAIREKDYKLATTYLTNELQQQLTPSHFSSFFGEFDEIKPITIGEEHKIALIKNLTPISATAKTYKIVFNKNLICDILDCN